MRLKEDSLRIAVVGGGISGLVCAYLLSQRHEIILFEANDYIGGHTNTVTVEDGERRQQVDTGFIVFNHRNYPNFTRLLDRLGVESQPSCMSFSLRCEKTGLEYNGTSLNGLFAQRRNLLRPSFLRMLNDILRFNREGKRLARSSLSEGTLGEFLAARNHGKAFVENYLVPISAAIWSSKPARISEFPLHFLLGFLDNHGMLNIGGGRPQWRVVRGGSARYVERIVRPFQEGIRLSSPVRAIRRHPQGVDIKTDHHPWERFDEVIVAAHSDQALRMLEDADEAERAILGSIGFQPNETVLHTDNSLLPRRRAAWASWNYHLLNGGSSDHRVAMTYHMNRLQNLRSDRQFCVTLNRGDDIDPSTVLRRMVYDHPIYSLEAKRAQQEHTRINGINRTHFCGAYWGHGFHEDGVSSALRVCQAFGVGLEGDLDPSDALPRTAA